VKVNSIILAGGKSRRFGRNKIKEKFQGVTLLERLLDRLANKEGEILIITADDSDIPELDKYSGCKIYHDIIPGKGSLGGIYTGLEKSDTFYNIVLAADMPFVNMSLINHMIEKVNDYDAVVPRLFGKVEPLHSVYSKNCIEPIAGMIEKRDLSITNLFPLVKTVYVNENEINSYDPEHISFYNINTESDYLKAREIAEKGVRVDQC
jgi:molybdenum cofactor guanylyltransferase